MTVNAGFRFDRYKGWLPEQQQLAGSLAVWAPQFPALANRVTAGVCTNTQLDRDRNALVKMVNMLSISAGIEAVFEQFFYDGSRTFDDFAGRDLVAQALAEKLDAAGFCGLH